MYTVIVCLIILILIALCACLFIMPIESFKTSPPPQSHREGAKSDTKTNNTPRTVAKGDNTSASVKSKTPGTTTHGASKTTLSASNAQTTRDSTSTNTGQDTRGDFNLDNNYISISLSNSEIQPFVPIPDIEQPIPTAKHYFFVTQYPSTKQMYKTPQEVVQILKQWGSRYGNTYNGETQNLYTQPLTTEKKWIKLNSMTTTDESNLLKQLQMRLQQEKERNATLNIVCCQINPNNFDTCPATGSNNYNCTAKTSIAPWANNITNTSGLFGNGGFNQQNANVSNQNMSGKNQWKLTSSYYTIHSTSDVVNNMMSMTTQCSVGCVLWVQIGNTAPVRVNTQNKSKITNLVQTIKSDATNPDITFCCVNKNVNISDIYNPKTKKMTCEYNSLCNVHHQATPQNNENGQSSDNESDNQPVPNNVFPDMPFSSYSDAQFGPITPSNNMWGSDSSNVSGYTPNILNSTTKNTSNILQGSLVNANTNATRSSVASNPYANVLNTYGQPTVVQQSASAMGSDRAILTANGAIVNTSPTSAQDEYVSPNYKNVRPSENMLKNVSQAYTSSFSNTQQPLHPDMVIQHVHVWGDNDCS